MTSVSCLPGEFELIAKYFAPLSKGFPGAYELQDDAAVIAPAPGHEIVAKTDAIVCGVHFMPDDPADLVARKALRVNLSDLAAKGAVARCYLLDLILPAGITEGWVAAFARGLAKDQETFGVHLIGGDTNATPGPLTVALTALGEVPEGRILRRGGARAGDLVYVSGTIGDAALGLLALREGLSGLEETEKQPLIARYRLPQPRVALGPRLIGLATATIDISDGLCADLGHICEVSRLGATISVGDVPLSASVRRVVSVDQDMLAQVLTGGDDYEILFTAPPDAVGRIDALSRDSGITLTRIGEMRPEPANGVERVTALGPDGSPLLLGRRGWRHF